MRQPHSSARDRSNQTDPLRAGLRNEDGPGSLFLICQQEAIDRFGVHVVDAAIGYRRHCEHPVTREACWEVDVFDDILGLIAIEAGRMPR